jgi:PEP-CTERM motif
MNARFLAIVLVGTTLLFASSARATSVRSGSGYGRNIGFPSCSAAVAAFDPMSPTNCIGVGTAPYTVDIGGTNYPVYQYAFVGAQGGVSTAAIYDVVDLGAVTAGSFFELPVFDTSDLTGVFACRGDNTGSNGTASTLVDSLSSTVTIPGGSTPLGCTPYNTATSSSIRQSSGLGEVEFTISSDVSDLTLFTMDGNLNTGSVKPTPEPGSLMLLGIGMATLAAVRRRRLSA